MKFAEDHRDDTMIALAGYADGMNRLSPPTPVCGPGSHPTGVQLLQRRRAGQIAAMFAQNYRVLVHPRAIAAIGRYTSWLTGTATNNPENRWTLIRYRRQRRYVRNVMSRPLEKMKARIVSDPSIDLATADSDLLRTVVDADMTDALREVLVSAGIPDRAGLTMAAAEVGMSGEGIGHTPAGPVG